jgi:Sortase domain
VGAGLVMLAVAAWGILAHQPRLPSAGPAPAWVRPVNATAAPAASRPAASPAGKAPAMPAVLPVGAQSIRIPSLQISAPASPESVTAGALAVPADPADVGWWMPSTAELVIDGHVDMEGSGPGALYEVRNLRPGAQVVVQTADGPEEWTIDGVRTYQKGHLPAGLFSWQGTAPRLVIITCGGPFDYATHHYYDNVVAYGSGG